MPHFVGAHGTLVKNIDIEINNIYDIECDAKITAVFGLQNI